MYKILFSFLLTVVLLQASSFLPATGNQIAKIADQQIGTEYVWGGNSLKTGVDCSALVKQIYLKFNYKIPRTAATQAKGTQSCPAFSLKNTQIGDTLYFQNASGHIHHVAIVTGFEPDGRPIITHAKGKNYGVVKERMSDRYVSEFIAAKRFYLCTAPLAKEMTSEEIAETLNYYADKKQIDVSVLYTLASIESDFDPLVITIETSPEIASLLKSLKDVGLRIKTGGTTFHSGHAVFNIFADDIEAAQFLAEALKEYGYEFDLGLMQIHSTNFTKEEAANLFYPLQNIKKSIEIFTTCSKMFTQFKDKIECYNRGPGNLKKAIAKGSVTYPYYARYKQHYKLYFGKEAPQ